MEKLSANKTASFKLMKAKLVTIGTEIKDITDQGRTVETDREQLFLFKGMYKELKPYFDKFNETWDNLNAIVIEADATDIFPTQQDKTLQQKIKRYYYESCAIYERHMNPTPTVTTSAHESMMQNTTLNESRTVRARLPQINLPSFNGDQTKWPLFRDTYLPLIHDEASLSNMEKFIFLVSCLQGPPLAMIKGIEMQDANYAQAWKLLTDTYNDKRRLANNYLKTVLDYVPLKSKPTAANFKHLLTTVAESIDSFKQLRIPNQDNFILFSLVLRCLDVETRRSFEKKYSTKEFPSYEDLIEFIKVEWRSLELTSEESAPYTSRFRFDNHREQPHLIRRNRTNTALLLNHQSSTCDPKGATNTTRRTKVPTIICHVCKGDHNLYGCNKFRNATPAERFELLKNWNGCRNCLFYKHSTHECKSTGRCKKCSRRHHTWLHTHSSEEASNQANSSSEGAVTLGSQSHQGEVLLGTAIIGIRNAKGTYTQVRAVTDSGSQHSFITTRCAENLGLIIGSCNRNVSGIGQLPLTGMIGRSKCSIRSLKSPLVEGDLNVEPLVVPQITGLLPHSPVPSSIRSLYKSYVLADDEFWKPAPVDFLLGGDLFYEILLGRPVTVSPDSPRLLPTIFGFVVAGPGRDLSTSLTSTNFLAQSAEEMKAIMTKFWDLEETSDRNIISEDDKHCEDHFTSSHRRLPSGRYVVAIPLKESVRSLINPKHQALTRFVNLESRLERNTSLKKEYHEFMKDYLTLGHMKLVPPGTSAYIIPHHAVTKLHNGQKKLRVVFDASCSTKSGSLNDHMYAGAKLQLSIEDILCNFRIHPYVFTADIVKMYRQILVDQSDRKYQHILWRFSPLEEVQEFELCTVTYGEKASPFLALRTIKQLVNDEGTAYPYASKALLEDIYVDDIVTGAQTFDQLLELKDQLIELLGKGKFQLSKWASNCPELLLTLNESEIYDSHVSLIDKADSSLKILGIQWNPKEDAFSYAICVPPWNPTKRAILSAIAKIYDPLGYLAPVIFYAKVILQEMWLAKVDWDVVGPSEVCAKWEVFLQQLHILEIIKISRPLSVSMVAHYRIVGFCDASLRGYSAVLYIHVSDTARFKVSLLKAKTKLAPKRLVTVPRLELSGAVLLSRLVKSCQRFIQKLRIAEFNFFTDSQVVLGWLSTPPETLHAFVGHRVVEILENTRRSEWGYTPSEENPADCGSRGLLPSELPNHPLWWTGPSWLSRTEIEWPTQVLNTKLKLPEIKGAKDVTLTSTNGSSSSAWMSRCSSYTRLVRATSYIKRFVEFLLHKTIVRGPVSSSEYKRAEQSLIRSVQSCYFSSKDKLVVNQTLLSLQAFIDTDGLVRVGGRLHNAKLPYDTKHPYILPADAHLTKILIDYYHVTHLHAGPTFLRAVLQRRFWIVGVKRLIRQRIFNCITCYKASRRPRLPLMGNLPTSRLAQGHVFANVGVDLAGPFAIRESSRRKAQVGKAYLCLFICMATKALHLEVVSKCSTDAFLAALSRFIARRGRPHHMYSDCGTNFVGAANKLRDLVQCLKSDQSHQQITDHLTPLGISWSFNPPSSPHFGGLWEAGVKSCKTILHKIIGEVILTFEELNTLFCKIEGILNSRPIAPVDSDIDSIDYLTPGHFLIGRPITALPEEQSSDAPTPLQRWKIINQKVQHFWARWRMDYLNTLQQRRKWKKEVPNLQVNDIVIIKEPNSTVKSWPLARVLETHKGKDGIVRVATIKTASGIYKRPVAKLVGLDPVNNPHSF